jgi:predicted signal transduction protein with EAL and GGDEF domain
VLAALRRTLRRTCEVTTALGAVMAIEAINSQAPFPVVVSDFNMPGMDGIEFLRWVAEHTPDTASILLTGNAKLDVAIAAVNAGYIFKFLTKPCPPEELLAAIAAARNRHEAKRADRILHSQAVDHDVLTGLPDRRGFSSAAAQLLEREPGMPVSLIVIAIDDFDLVRRTLGHSATDHLIVAASRRLQTAIRDPRHQLEHALLFRIDDRLAVLWYEHTTARVDLVATHLIKSLELDVPLAGQKIRLAAHAGVTGFGGTPVEAQSTVDPLTALRNAEAACLEASAAKGSRIGHFSASMHAREQRRLDLSQRLRRADFEQHLRCAFQPQWALQTNRLIGIEALARWQDPELGAVSPAEFVPLAEEDPEIADRLARWILDCASRQRLAWRALLPEDVRIAVNISATQLRADNLHERILESLSSTGLPANLLEVEITESVAIAEFTRSTAQLLELRRLGIGVAIDDFGVGYSSLSYLAELPATCLKIDRAFITGIERRTRGLDLLRGICSLGRAMQMSVIVEGVESLGVAKWLRAVGCDAVQGYAIARPTFASAFEEWYQRERASISTALAEGDGSGVDHDGRSEFRSRDGEEAGLRRR